MRILGKCIKVSLILAGIVLAYLAGGKTPLTYTRLTRLAPGVQVSNPAGAYCSGLGFEYQIVTRPDGSQDGYCVMPDSTRCEAWDFYAGSCGQAYSACAQDHLQTITMTDGEDPYAERYSLCVDPAGKKESKPARDLAHLDSFLNLKTTQLAPPAEQVRPLKLGSKLSDVLPETFSWRDLNGVDWVTSVKDQASCGSCWAFGAVAVAEAWSNIQADNPDLDLDLSEQNLVNCVNGSTCSGGSSSSALSYIHTNGIVDEACDPYTARDGTCSSGRCSDWQSRLTKVGQVYTNWYPTSRDEIKQQVKDYGPAVVYMGIGGQLGGSFDANRVYHCSDDTSNYNINHAVTIVGWDDAGQYWLVKNSWGTWWETGGYFKLGYGECNVEKIVAMNILPPSDVDAGYTLDGTPGLNGWYRSAVTAHLQAKDSGGAPVSSADVYFRVDGGQWANTSGGSTDVIVEGTGTHTLDFYAQVGNGAAGPLHSLTVKIDSDAPSSQWSSAPQQALFESTLTLAVEPTDQYLGSGVSLVEFYVYYENAWHKIATASGAPYSYAWTPGVEIPQGQWLAVAVQVYDQAGNSSFESGGDFLVYFGGSKVFLPMLIH